MNRIFSFSLVCFIALSSILFQIPLSKAQSLVLPTQSEVTLYVNQLIRDYDKLVILHYSLNPNFNAIVHYFPLYATPQFAFQVIVLQTSENSSSVTLIFKNVPSLVLPNIIIDNADNFQSVYVGNLIQFGSAYWTLQNVGVQFGDTNNVFPLAIIVPSNDLGVNYAQTASVEANNIFQFDSKALPPEVLLGQGTTQTTTSSIAPISSTTTQTETSSNSTKNQNTVTWNILVLVFGISVMVWVLLFAHIQDNPSYSKKTKILVEYVFGGFSIFGLLGFIVTPPTNYNWFSLQALSIYSLIPIGIVIFYRRNILVIASVLKKPKNQPKAKSEATKKAEKGNKPKELKQDKSNSEHGKETK